MVRGISCGEIMLKLCNYNITCTLTSITTTLFFVAIVDTLQTAMSGRGLVPLILAAALGIANGQWSKDICYYSFQVDIDVLGYVVFNPAFQEREAEKIRQQQ